ncbi:DUF58 domain-containing protein [Methyloversatilis sp.]|uniref:DUF58 domain-containing protein n=1 Tax=Methyloversatilis sp. TaxID=2569862 RepID=UPI0035B00213
MTVQRDFHYRMPLRVSGQRPGAHRSSSTGSGQEFIAHQTLFDRPDPRRLDLRASIRDPEGRWLVRVNRQRAGIPVYLVADVSASMAFGSGDSKLERLAQFALSLGDSVFRTGDALGMLAYDGSERTDLMLAPMHSRGAGPMMSDSLSRARADQPSTAGILEACARIAGRQALVFLASDFHAPLQQTSAALDLLSHAHVVPMVVWDEVEAHAPEGDGLLALRDVETGGRRGLWLRPQIRRRWADAFAQRRDALDALFSSRGVRPFYMTGRFDADAMSRYFFEAV